MPPEMQRMRRELAEKDTALIFAELDAVHVKYDREEEREAMLGTDDMGRRRLRDKMLARYERDDDKAPVGGEFVQTKKGREGGKGAKVEFSGDNVQTVVRYGEEHGIDVSTEAGFHKAMKQMAEAEAQ